MTSVLDYSPPPVIKKFILDHRRGELFYSWIVGPYGSGKTTANFFKLIYLAALQEPSPDGVRRTRAVIVRNTMPQLKDTTLVSWNYWFKDGQAGHWNATDKIFTLRWRARDKSLCECVVMFRPLDTEDDVARVLSLEINFAIIDEFVEIPRKIIEHLSGRVGRYKFPDGTKPTIWGMWGASNPGNEDIWWYDYLHGQLPPNVHYFHQPSGLGPDAENLENLPGGRAYYTNQSIGKSEAFIKQFLEAEWGFSISGKPVVPTFKPDRHVAKKPLIFNPRLPLVIGLDPGLGGSAMLYGQETLEGRLNVLAEQVQTGYGAERLISEKIIPLLNARFRDAEVVIAPDPAAFIRSQSDERTVVDRFLKYRNRWSVRGESNNRLPLRLDAIDHFTTRSNEYGDCLQIDSSCTQLIRALKGGWRWAVDTKKDIIKSQEPEDNPFTHVGDGFGYLCRYFHRSAERATRQGQTRFVPPRTFGPNYHIR